MQQALDQFRANIQHVRNLHGLHVYFSAATTPALDLSDLLRAQIVLVVSALDFYIHEVTRLGMIEILESKRPSTPAFLKFPVTLGGAIGGMQTPNDTGWLDNEIRLRHGIASFQHPDKIADAIRLFSPVEIWNEVSLRMSLPTVDLRNRLRSIVDRRNKIAHEADVDPSFPGVRWPITANDAIGAMNFVEQICETIHLVIV